MIFNKFTSKSSHPFHPLNQNILSKRSAELISLISDASAVAAVSNNDHPLEERHSSELNRTNENEFQETTNQQVCRICYSAGDLQTLIAPCQCSGTMGILHQPCLERWLEISNTNKCEICQYEYELIRYPRSLIYFLTNPLRPSDLRYLINDLILFIFLTAIISWLFIATFGKMHSAANISDGFSLLLLPSAVLFIYFVWCWVSFRYHLHVLKEWRSVNQLIRVKAMKKVESDRSFSPVENGEHVLSEIRIFK